MIFNIFDFGMDPKAAVASPYFLALDFSSPMFSVQHFRDGDFSDEILNALRSKGQKIKLCRRKKKAVCGLEQYFKNNEL